MPTRAPDALFSASALRRQQGAARTLREREHLVDMSSNDYLGLSRMLGERARLGRIIESLPAGLGATGSRLVSGHTPYHDQLEEFLASFHHAESALLFGSGYEANVGLLSSIASRSDTIIYDELVHASMRDGVRLSNARGLSFQHNNMDSLKSKISLARGTCFVAVESVYSMDGDFAPLEELTALAEETGAYLIVDEAHATGLLGSEGEGLVVAKGLAQRVFARVHTFGKALGYRGACVIGPSILREHLINKARPFIYSTALDLFALEVIREAYRLGADAHQERRQLFGLIKYWREEIQGEFSNIFLQSESAIQGVRLVGNAAVTRLEELLRDNGFFARAIRSPTVASGHERVRLCLHAFNTHEQISSLLAIIRGYAEREMRA